VHFSAARNVLRKGGRNTSKCINVRSKADSGLRGGPTVRSLSSSSSQWESSAEYLGDEYPVSFRHLSFVFPRTYYCFSEMSKVVGTQSNSHLVRSSYKNSLSSTIGGMKMRTCI
jgi:hypothetical protein